MKNTSTAALAASLLFAASCKDDVQPGTNTYPSYSRLKTGNYWVYEVFSVDSNGNGLSTGFTDSCFISQDTVMNGNTYYFLNDPAFNYSTIGNRWLRDSADCIVDQAGRIYFSATNFTTPFYSYPLSLYPDDTAAIVTEQMAAPNTGFAAPAGTFVVSDSRVEYRMLKPPYDLYGKYRYLHRRFAQDAGLVSETLPFYSSNPNYTEKRLLRYHLN